MRRILTLVAAIVSLLVIATSPAQQTNANVEAARQTETDEYTRYELLAPETNSFRIRYEVTAASPGVKFYFNPIRKGSTATDEAVFDAMTGKPLEFHVVSGSDARKDPLMSDAEADTNYIKVQLARAVPPQGQGRILILK